jgi:hypothetical protein
MVMQYSLQKNVFLSSMLMDYVKPQIKFVTGLLFDLRRGSCVNMTFKIFENEPFELFSGAITYYILYKGYAGTCRDESIY